MTKNKPKSISDIACKGKSTFYCNWCRAKKKERCSCDE